MFFLYISALCNKYTWFMGINVIYLIHHLINRYGKTTETDLKEKQRRFEESLDTTVPIEKYFNIIDNCIHYVDDIKQTYMTSQIIINFYNMVLSMGLYKKKR